MKEFIIQTPRLGLRPWLDSDIEPFYSMSQDDDVMRYLPSKYSLEQCKLVKEKINQRYEDFGYCLYAAEHLESGSFIGWLGIQNFQFPWLDSVEIGWRIDKKYWDQGLTTEGANAVLKHSFEELKLKQIFSFTTLDNLASERVMQKIGMDHIGEFEHPSLEEGHRLRRHCLYLMGG